MVTCRSSSDSEQAVIREGRSTLHTSLILLYKVLFSLKIINEAGTSLRPAILFDIDNLLGLK